MQDWCAMVGITQSKVIFIFSQFTNLCSLHLCSLYVFMFISHDFHHFLTFHQWNVLRRLNFKRNFTPIRMSRTTASSSHQFTLCCGLALSSSLLGFFPATCQEVSRILYILQFDVHISSESRVLTFCLNSAKHSWLQVNRVGLFHLVTSFALIAFQPKEAVLAHLYVLVDASLTFQLLHHEGPRNIFSKRRPEVWKCLSWTTYVSPTIAGRLEIFCRRNLRIIYDCSLHQVLPWPFQPSSA